MAKSELAQKIYGNPSWIDGRINRLEYFWRSFKYAFLFVGMALVACASFLLGGGGLIGGALLIAFMLLALLFYWRLLMGAVKRLHDLDFSGWWVILMLGITDYSYTVNQTKVSFNLATYLFGETIGNIFSIIGMIFCLFLTFKRGTIGPNKYGKDPLTKYEGGK